MLVRDSSKVKKISDFISLGKQSSLTPESFTQRFVIGELNVPIVDVIRDKYYDIIKQNSHLVEFDDDRVFQSVMYSPRRLSLVLYGTTDLWHLLLWINNMKSNTEFTKKKIYIFDPERLDLINDIINKESHLLNDTTIVNTNVIVKDS